MVEGDRQMLEQVYWKGTLDDLPAVASVQAAQIEAESGEPATDGGGRDLEPDNTKAMGSESVVAPPPPVDPLSTVQVGL
jgi:hypothetical protein